MIKRGSKKGYEFSFAWIFAMFVGAAFIGLAIYSATQLISSKQTETESGQAKQIGVLLTPIETGLEEGKFAILSVQDETRIFNSCRNVTSANPFGSQNLAVSITDGLGGSDERPGIESTFHNKYIFSSKIADGDKRFYVLSKPFDFPFKVADLTILWSDNERFCFDSQSTPSSVKEELEDLNLSNVYLMPLETCPSTSEAVCFGRNCDISVNTFAKTVTKDGTSVIYTDSLNPGSDDYALLYAAIFSDPEIYTCQVQRIVARAAELSSAYYRKSETLSASASPCASTIAIPLIAYHDNFLSFVSAGETDVTRLYTLAVEVEDKNPQSCKLW